MQDTSNQKFLLCLLLLRLHLFQSKKFLSLQLVQLAQNVLDRILQSRRHVILQSVDASIRRLNRLIQRHERRLQRRQLALQSPLCNHRGSTRTIFWLDN